MAHAHTLARNDSYATKARRHTRTHILRLAAGKLTAFAHTAYRVLTVCVGLQSASKSSRSLSVRLLLRALHVFCIGFADQSPHGGYGRQRSRNAQDRSAAVPQAPSLHRVRRNIVQHLVLVAVRCDVT
jgi:hypothetical protein